MTAGVDHAPPNDGAHRLAWWLSHGDSDMRLRRLEGGGLSAHLLDRVLTGEVVPASAVARGIAEATGGAVLPEDWDAGATGAWVDAPLEPPVSRAAS